MASSKRKNDNIQGIQRFSKSAAFLEREFSARNRSIVKEKFSPKPKKRIFAFDTNVLARLAAGSTRKSRGNDYGIDEILPFYFGDKLSEEEKAEANRLSQEAGTAIVSYVLDMAIGVDSQTSERLPVFQFPGHLKETEGHFRKIKKEVGVNKSGYRDAQNRDSFNLIGMAASISAFQTEGEGDFSDVEIVSQLVEEIANPKFSGKAKASQAIAQWDAFLDLNLRSGGVFPLNMAYQFSDGLSQFKGTFQFLEGGNITSDEKSILIRVSDFWEAELIRTRRAQTQESRANAKVDALALAQLYHVNTKLLDSDYDVIFVTHDKKLVETVYEAELSKVAGVNEEVAKRFARKFVRHVWAYTSDAIVEPDRRDEFINWLASLFSDISGTGITSDKNLTAFARGQKTLHISKSKVEKSIDDWRQITTNGISQFTLRKFENDREKYDRLMSSFLGKIEEVRNPRNQKFSSWRALIDELEELNDQYKDRAFLNFSNIGVESIIDAAKFGQRNPPDLDFESLSNTKNILLKLRTDLSYPTDGALEFYKDYQKIKDDCYDSSQDQDDRQESHLKFLVLGAAFASANKWTLALSQAERAIWIVERSRDRLLFRKDIPTKPAALGEPKSNISGREAYFLASVSQRITARSDLEIEQARSYLKRAREALKEDKRKDTAKKSNFFKFEAESLAIALSQYYLHRYRDENDFCDRFVRRLRVEAQSVLDSLPQYDANGIGFGLESDFSKELKKVTLINVCVNLIQVAAINQFRVLHDRSNLNPHSLDLITLQTATNIIEGILHNVNSGKLRIHETFLIKVYYDLGQRLIALENGTKLSDADLDQLYKDYQANLVSVYDCWRYRKLKELAQMISKQQ